MTTDTDDARTSEHEFSTITCAELARRVGCARSSVSRAVRHGALAPALTEDGLVNAAHPAVGRWAARLGMRPELVLVPARRAARKRRGQPPGVRRFVARPAS